MHLAVVDVQHALGDTLMFSANENIRTKLISRIRAEKVRLDVAVWYLTDRRVSQAIIDKYRSGVPVRVLGDRVSIFENDRNTRREFEYLATNGVPIRVRYHPTWFPRIMHWKAAIFAGQNLVEFGSANYTAYELRPWSSTNYHDEVAYFTRDRAIVNALKTQFDRFWADTTVFKDFHEAYQLEQGEAFAVPVVIDRSRLEPDRPMPGDMVWGQGPELNRRMVSEIRRKTRFIHMVVFRLTDAQITQALVDRHRAGVPVRVIIEPAEYNRRTYPEYEMTRARIDTLWAAGIPVRQRAHDGLTHMKTLITSRVALIASSNFTNNWQRDHNYFLPQVTKPDLHLEMRNRFRAMWNAVRASGDVPPAFRRFAPGRPGAARLTSPSTGRSGSRARLDSSGGGRRGPSRTTSTWERRHPPFSSWRAFRRVVSRTNATRVNRRMIANSRIWSVTAE